MPNWKKVITSGSNASLNTLTVTNGVIGNVIGTSSYATYAETSSYSTTLGASFNNSAEGVLRLMNSAGNSISAISLIASASITSETASYSTTLGASLDSSAIGQLKLLNSDGVTINTFSSVTATTASLAFTASYVQQAISSSFATTASYVLQAVSASYALTAQTLLGSVTSASFASTASFVKNAQTASLITNTVTGTTSTDLVYANMADNDQFRIRVGGTATNAGFVEIATADDGTEPIHVRQYSGVFTSLTRTATLLDGSGNSSFPGGVTATSFTGSLRGTATTASFVLNAISSSFATTASFVTGSIFTSGNKALSASYAVSASFAPTAGKISAAVNLFNYYNFT